MISGGEAQFEIHPASSNLVGSAHLHLAIATLIFYFVKVQLCPQAAPAAATTTAQTWRLKRCGVREGGCHLENRSSARALALRSAARMDMLEEPVKMRALVDQDGRTLGSVTFMQLRVGVLYTVNPDEQPDDDSEGAGFLLVRNPVTQESGYVIAPDEMLAEQYGEGRVLQEVEATQEDELSAVEGEFVYLLTPYGATLPDGWVLACRERSVAVPLGENIIGLLPAALVTLLKDGIAVYKAQNKIQPKLTHVDEEEIAAVHEKIAAPFGNRAALDAGTHSHRAVSVGMTELFDALADDDDDIKADALVQLSLLLDMSDTRVEFEALCAVLRDFYVVGSAHKPSLDLASFATQPNQTVKNRSSN